MTTIKIYPLWSNTPNVANMIKYANTSFNVKKTESHNIDKTTGENNVLIEISQTLTATQKNTIKDIFRGTAFLEFS